MKLLRVIVAVASALTPSGAVRAQAHRDFLRPAQPAQLLADARPWDSTTGDGHNAKIIFNPDGTGTFEGPFTMSSKWEIKGDDICVTIRVAGIKCLRFVKTQNGLDGYRDRALDLRLRR